MATWFFWLFCPLQFPSHPDYSNDEQAQCKHESKEDHCPHCNTDNEGREREGTRALTGGSTCRRETFEYYSKIHYVLQGASCHMQDWLWMLCVIGRSFLNSWQVITFSWWGQQSSSSSLIVSICFAYSAHEPRRTAAGEIVEEILQQRKYKQLSRL